MKYEPPQTDDSATATVIGLLQARARQYGSKVAFRNFADTQADPVEVSYATLDRRAKRIAARLQSFCGTLERVLLVFPPGVEYVSAFFGSVYSGNFAVPVFPPRPYRVSTRLEAIVRDAQPAVVLSTGDLRDRFEQIPELHGIPWLITDDLSDEFD